MRRTLLVTLMIFCVGCGFPVGEFLGTANPGPYSGIMPVTWEGVGGTCWVVRDEGETVLVVTAAHVVGWETHVLVDGLLSPVVAVDEDTDLAIIRVTKYERRWKVWQMADAKVEEEARAVGFTWPLGTGSETFLIYRGYITTVDFIGFVAFNGGAFPGLSGGPLINRQGKVIGVCSQFGGAWGIPFDTCVMFSPIENVRILLETVN